MKNLCKGEIFIFNLFLIHIPWATTHTKHSSITRTNKNAFQQDAHRRLVDHIPACIAGGTCPGVYLPGSVPALGGGPAQGCTWLGGGGCTCWGCTCPGEHVPSHGGCTCQGWCTCQGVPVQGNLSGGVNLPRGLYLPGGVHLPGGYPPPVNRMTDRCKNITLAQTSFCGR